MSTQDPFAIPAGTSTAPAPDVNLSAIGGDQRGRRDLSPSSLASVQSMMAGGEVKQPVVDAVREVLSNARTDDSSRKGSEASARLPPGQEPTIDPDVLRQIASFANGQTNIPPPVPGLEHMLAKHLGDPGEVVLPSLNQILPQSTPPSETPPAPVVPSAPAIDPTMLAFMQQQQAQTQALIEALNRKAAVPQKTIQERMIEQGFNPALEADYERFQMREMISTQAAELERIRTAMEARQYQEHAQQAVAGYSDWAKATVTQNFPGVELPTATLQAVAQQAFSLASTGRISQEEALLASLQGYAPLLEQMAAAKKAAPKQAPVAAPAPQAQARSVNPALAQLRMVPQFANMTDEQLAGVLQVMNSSATSGAGRGRHEALSVHDMRRLLFS